jgi:hypothetical protein
MAASPCTDHATDGFLRYEAEWCYTCNVAAGEDVRIIDDASDAFLSIGDFFIIDGEQVIRSHYDGAGRFVGAEILNDASTRAPFIAFADVIWQIAQPFTDWWERHPECHRSPAT